MLLALVGAPLALGSVHEPAFVPLLVLTSLAGLASLSGDCAGWRAAVRRLPGAAAIAAFTALIVFQLLPLPPSVLSLLSPGSFAHHDQRALVPLTAWHPISLNPADTGRGLAFWLAFALLYAAAQREGECAQWRRRVMLAVAGTGAVMTIEALVQAASAHPGKIYGLWTPVWDKAVFGPYVNYNHGADFLAMATCLALGLLVQAIMDLAAVWRRRHRGWLTLGDREGTRTLWLGSLTLVLLVGLFASHSRGGLVALVSGLLAFTLLLHRKALGALGVGLVLVAALCFVDPEPTLRAFRARGWSLRPEIWTDVFRAVPHFPLFGAGFNAYGTVSDDYRTSQEWGWIGQTHNDYLQVLIDTGLVGCAIIGTLLFLLARRALGSARRSPVDAGLAAALAACAVHNLVEFNWQIPANAATFIVISGLVMRRDPAAERDDMPPAVNRRPPALTVAERRI